eukprot:10929710-Heterocapsa_arctica.AAC.1
MKKEEKMREHQSFAGLSVFACSHCGQKPNVVVTSSTNEKSMKKNMRCGAMAALSSWRRS